MKFIWLFSFFSLYFSLNANTGYAPTELDFTRAELAYHHIKSKPISDSLIFRYGNEAYLKKVRVMKYPREAVMSEQQGTMIFKITVNPEGTMKATLLTDLGKEINMEVALLIENISDQFLVQPEEYSIYQTIFFSLHNDFQEAFEGAVDGFKTEYDGLWMEPFKVHLMMMSRTVSTSGAPIGSISSARKTISTSEASRAFNVSNKRATDYQLKNYNSKLKQYEKHLAKGKTKKAYNAVSDLIRYNPFDIKLIQARRRMEKELEVDTYRAFDIPLVVALTSTN
ncbi:hypothetical protein ACV07N_02345 [Roseivirga echinicomitans]